MRAAPLVCALLLSLPALAQVGAIELLEGAQRVLRLPGITKVSVGDPSIADVKTIGNDDLLIIGNEAGQTTILVWLRDGQRKELVVAVKHGELEAAEVEGLQLEQGQLKTLKATGITGLELGEPKVLEAKLKDGKLQLRALAAGRSDVRLLRKAGAAMLVVEVISAQSASLTLTGVELHVGQSVTVMIEGSVQATSKNAAAVEAKVAAPGRVSLRGLMPGRCNVEVTVAGQAMQLPVEVVK